MKTAPVHPRLPRAGIDRITGRAAALQMLTAAIHRPLRHETIVLALDDRRRGIAVVVVSGTRRPDAVLDVVECLTRHEAHGGRMGAIVVASVRPDMPADDPPDERPDADVDRWLEMSDIADDADVELLEWFVIDRRVSCPRDQLGEPPRW